MENDNKRTILLEIYKLHVEMADKVTERRAQTNKFYISIQSVLLAIIGLMITNLNNHVDTKWILLFGSILGILLSIVWWFNIKSYRQLNSGKFKTLHDLEIQLPYQFYSNEWILLGEGKKSKVYFQLSRVEQYTPIIISIPYAIILIISISM